MAFVDGRGLLCRLHDGDLDSIDVGDFIDRHLGGEDPVEGHLPELEGVAADFAHEADALVASGTIALWRAVGVVGDVEAWAFDPTGPNGLGECWSSDPAGAAPYGGGAERGTPRVLLGRVTPDAVDWAATCIMRAVKPEQAEVRLLMSATVEILGITDGHGRELPCPVSGHSLPVSGQATSPSP